MGTFATIDVHGRAEAGAVAAMNSAFSAIGSVEMLMHPTRPGSDLARLNVARAGQVIAVDHLTLELLRLTRHVAQMSQGLFDPCLPSSDGRIQDLVPTEDGCVRCSRPVAVDFGGIAKGFAVDEAVRALQEHGCENALVNIGGDMRAIGPAEHMIGVRLADGQVRNLGLRNAALAVSDANAKDGPREHRGYYSRVADRPLRKMYVAVMAPTAVSADALTKCAMYCENDEWLRLAAEFNAALVG
jgi:thiamine biosynthesis lipoprotein